jgi:hypothetical protein
MLADPITVLLISAIESSRDAFSAQISELQGADSVVNRPEADGARMKLGKVNVGAVRGEMTR